MSRILVVEDEALIATMIVPFVFATGHSDSALPPRFARSLTLSKPFDFDALGRVITAFATGCPA